jgi:hypothetical protein
MALLKLVKSGKEELKLDRAASRDQVRLPGERQQPSNPGADAASFITPL